MSTTKHQHGGRTENETFEELYDQAEHLPIDIHLGVRADDFAEAVVDEVGLPLTVNGHEMDRPFTTRRIADAPDDLDAVLLVFPDETRQFIGIDETAKGRGYFSFVIKSGGPLPMIRTVPEALDLLKPPGVHQALVTSETTRQGEWFLLDTDDEPAGSVFKPGVAKRPFGGSPLGNHIPREYGLGVSDDEFMGRVKELDNEMFEGAETPQDVFDRVGRAEIPVGGDVELVTELLDESDLLALAENVYVRGTLRHRENDHFMEKIGDEWKVAKTHDVDVYTPDQVGMRTIVRID